MYISEQLLNPDARRLRLSAQFGVQHVVLDNRSTEGVSATHAMQGGVVEWDARKLRDYRHWVEGFDLKLDVFALDVGAILLDSLVDLDSARKSRDILARNIAVAADAGIECLKYNVQMVGITRTALKPGRGGCSNSGFCHAEYTPEADRRHSYWGVGYPTAQEPAQETAQKKRRQRQRTVVRPERSACGAACVRKSRLGRHRIPGRGPGQRRRPRGRAAGLPPA